MINICGYNINLDTKIDMDDKHNTVWYWCDPNIQSQMGIIGHFVLLVIIFLKLWNLQKIEKKKLVSDRFFGVM